MKDILINKRYRIDRKIGEGGFGKVFAGTDIRNGNKVAIKLEENREDPRALKSEEEIYRELAGTVGIPSVYYYEQEVEYNVLVMELLGPSLEDLFNYCNRKFSLKTILLIADQAICRIERIHRRYIHRDIKPDNLLLGTGRRGNVLYTVDFGVAKEFAGEERYLRLRGLPVGGTTYFATLRNHEGLRTYPRRTHDPYKFTDGAEDQSWRDDLESLGYMFVYFARGSLPWEGLKEPELIKQMKMSLSSEDLCQDLLPIEFATYINYTRSLDARDKPNYRYLRNLFRNRFRSEGFEYDHVFDWTTNRFFELHSESG
ncbi:casein kinase I isoform delta [Xylariaceae sp. AK1471]|nr:casein kinase I isoform delta [Xylariaceae sp. AK1471]